MIFGWRSARRTSTSNPSVRPVAASVCGASVNGKRSARVLIEPDRLRESRVEVGAAGAGDVRHHAVEDPAALFVGVESVVQEQPQEPAALRRAEDVEVSAARRHHRAVAVFHRRGDIANRGQTDAGHRRILRAIAQLVNSSGLESRGERHPRATRIRRRSVPSRSTAPA